MDRSEQLLRADLRGAAFRIGAYRGQWEFVRLLFPYLWVRIPKPLFKPGPDFFLLRIDCSGYPGPLTAQLWDAVKDQALPVEQRPYGATGVLTAFSAWSACLYHPIDRLARDHWPGQFDDQAWRPGADIVSFLEVVHALIRDPAYVQSSAPSASAELPSEPLEEDASDVA
ncbi:DUF7665 family protein [Caulobacter sp. RL271]|uniref:Uncharacterized protein n=1 Tax=Caulobacter segnis TaxID=88688 RepID=A0ABY4ZT65_9CAUL|nr:hypothetical protein [Caulobacter segnis]USQ95896.1 hypothetical protein MZV50_25730 [Caulobacter segnis]